MMTQLRPDELVGFVLRVLDLLRRLGQETDREQRGLLSLTIGKLAFQQLRSSADPAQWRLWLELTHAALTQSLLEIDRRRFQWAECQLLLGQACAEIARWTGDLASAHRASTLVSGTSDHPAVRDLVGLGLFDWQPVSREIGLLEKQLADGHRTTDYDLLSQLIRPALHVDEDRRRICEAYHLDYATEPTPAPGWWRGLLLAFGVDPGLSGVHGAPPGLARRTLSGERSSDSQAPDPPAVYFRMALPTVDDPRAPAPGRTILLQARSIGEATTVRLYDEQTPGTGGGAGLPGWQIGVVPADGQQPVFAANVTDDRGETTLGVTLELLCDGTLMALAPGTPRADQ